MDVIEGVSGSAREADASNQMDWLRRAESGDRLPGITRKLYL